MVAARYRLIRYSIGFRGGWKVDKFASLREHKEIYKILIVVVIRNLSDVGCYREEGVGVRRQVRALPAHWGRH